MKKKINQSNLGGNSEQTPAKAVKVNKRLLAILVPVISVIVILAIVLPVVLLGNSGNAYFTVPESKLPTEEKFALTKYNYDELDDVQVTLRADILNVKERGLPRYETTLLGDDFSLVYDTDKKEMSAQFGTVPPSANLKTAQIHFSQYPSPSNEISAAKFADEAAAAGVSPAAYFTYYKYMLMTQGQNLAHEAMRRSKASYRELDPKTDKPITERGDESLSGWLKKHPSADAQYGAVLGENNAVEKEITLDPLYRGQHAAGLYLPAGEVATVKIKGLKPGEKVIINLGEHNTLAWRGGIPKEAETVIANETGGFNTVKFPNSTSDTFFKKADLITALGKFYDYNTTATPFLQSQWARQNWRAPWLGASFTLDKDGEYEIGFAFGGIIHIHPSNCYSAAKLTFTGAVETPHYILGVTTPEYFDEYLRDAPGVIGVIDTENGQLIGPTGVMGTTQYMRQIKKDEVDKLAMLWHSFFSVNESFTGGVYNRYNKVMFDWHVPAGAAVALGGHTYACPTSWFNNATNYRGLLRTGQWGILHEVGHNHGAAYGVIWGFGAGRDGEVRNNALTLLSYISSCDIGTHIRSGGEAEHGEYANPYSVLTETLRFKGKKGDYDDGSYGYFQCLGMYANIMHSFGAEKYYELLYTYKSVSSYSSNKRADFAYRCSLIYGMNFINYFNNFYCANITEEMLDAEQLGYMKSLPNYEPISNFYAGTIDGVKTAGDYEVAFGNDLTFDLKSTTISSLDTEDGKGFEIISVEQPEHGKITELGDGKWSYSFDKEYTGVFDEFSFSVKLSDGVIHKFTITLRISYNGAGVSVYKGIENPGVGGAALMDAMEAQTAREPDEKTNSTFAGVPNFSATEWQVKKSDFWWKAPETGTLSLAISGNNGLCLYFGETFETLERTNLAYTGGAQYNHAFEVNVEKDKYYAVRIMNVNRGGSGGATVGLKKENGSYTAIPAEQIFHPDYPLGQVAEKYVFEPVYYVSKKDNIKLSTTGTDKSEWSVISAPENIQDGRFYEEEMIDPDKHEVIGTMTYDKWDWLIDGQTNTIFHTAWKGAGVKPPSDAAPDVFIIDTAREQPFNYFTITTRHTHNDDARIKKYRLSVSTDNENYTTVSEGEELAYKVTSGTKVANLKFGEVNGRYWKLEVFSTSGKNYTIVSELDAGVQSNTQKVVPPTSKMFFTTGGWVNSSTIDTEPNGYMISTGKNEKMVVKFVGESIALYAATGSGYGTADVYVDGVKSGSINLNSHTDEARKLVFVKESLEIKEHTVEIITTSADKVMLNVIGIPYTASLVNAPNIYAERALTISLVVFVLLFAAVFALIMVLIFVPKFRSWAFGNKLIEKLDNRPARPKKTVAAKTETAEPVAKETTVTKTKTTVTRTTVTKKPAESGKSEPVKAQPVKTEEKRTVVKKPADKNSGKKQ